MRNILLVAFYALFLAACNTTEQARDVDKKSGFLKDYSMLKEGGDDEAPSDLRQRRC